MELFTGSPAKCHVTDLSSQQVPERSTLLNTTQKAQLTSVFISNNFRIVNNFKNCS